MKEQYQWHPLHRRPQRVTLNTSAAQWWTTIKRPDYNEEGSESFPSETALKNSCNVKVAISKKQSGTCNSKNTPKKRKKWVWKCWHHREPTDGCCLLLAQRMPTPLAHGLQPRTALVPCEAQTLSDQPVVVPQLDMFWWLSRKWIKREEMRDLAFFSLDLVWERVSSCLWLPYL